MKLLEFPAVSVNVPVTSTNPPAVIVPVVMLKVVPVPIVIDPSVNDAVVPVIPPVPTSETVGLPVTLFPEVVSSPEPDVSSVFDTSIALVCEMVPLIVK